MTEKSPQRRFKLASVLIACIGVLVMLATGTVLAVQWLSSRYVLSELSGALIQSGVENLDRDIKQHLDPAAELVRFLKAEIESGRVQLSDPASLQLIMTGSIAAAPQIGAVFVMDESRLAYVLTRDFRQQAHVFDQYDWQDHVDVAKTFTEAKERGGIYWAEPVHVDRSKRTIINVRAPIVQNGETTGVIAASVSVRELTAFTKLLAKRDSTTPFVLYGSELVLAHPDLDKFLDQFNDKQPLINVKMLSDPVIAEFANAVPFESALYPAPDGVEIKRVTAGNSDYLLITRTIKGYGDLPLVVGVHTRMDTIWETFKPFYLAGLFGLIVLGLAIVAGVLISKRLARPITRASNVARAVGDLEFEQIQLMAPSSISELDDLSSSFNKMLNGLRMFGRYVPRGLVRKLVADGHDGAGSLERELTVMFTDMRNFTSLSEGKSANEVATFLNEHLTMLSECVEAEGGTIDKYIGDSVMAFWGAPEESERTAESACRAALRMCAKVESANQARGHGEPPLGLRVGIHSGQLVVGDIGSPSRINYTVVGDVVNTTQRLEALGKEVDPSADTIILLSQPVREELPDTFRFKDEGLYAVKGKRQKIGIFRLLDGPYL